MKKGVIGLTIGTLLLCVAELAGADNFFGNYTVVHHYDLNISNGVQIEKDTAYINIDYAAEPQFFSITWWDEGSEPYSLPDHQLFTPNRLEQPVRNTDWGDSISIDSLFISNGTHMAAALINQEKDNPADISVSVASWHRRTPTSGIFQGLWNVTLHNNPNLRDTQNGFQETTILRAAVTLVDENTVLIPWDSTQVALEVSGNTAYLPAPVNTGMGLLHAMYFSFDQNSLSFFSIESELDDPTDVSVTIGYGSSVPCPADFDEDGDVDGSDLAAFTTDFGRTDCIGDCEGDFDGDNVVDGSDLIVFAADFGRTDCPTPSGFTPEELLGKTFQLTNNDYRCCVYDITFINDHQFVDSDGIVGCAEGTCN